MTHWRMTPSLAKALKGKPIKNTKINKLSNKKRPKLENYDERSTTRRHLATAAVRHRTELLAAYDPVVSGHIPRLLRSAASTRGPRSL